MFLGHYALGFAAKRAAPRAPLFVLLAAPQVADLLWPVFVLLGLERVRVVPGDTAFTPLAFDSYPWSHSLVMLCLWAAVFAGVAWWLTRDRATALFGALLVVSHWVLDVAMHRPDMPVSPFGGPRVGLGLWDHPLATVLIEGALFTGGVGLYLASTQARDRAGRWVLAALVGFLALVYAAAVAGPPPPSATAVAVSALSLWLIPVWGAWVERHRSVRGPGEPAAVPPATRLT